MQLSKEGRRGRQPERAIRSARRRRAGHSVATGIECRRRYKDPNKRRRLLGLSLYLSLPPFPSVSDYSTRVSTALALALTCIGTPYSLPCPRTPSNPPTLQPSNPPPSLCPRPRPRPHPRVHRNYRLHGFGLAPPAPLQSRPSTPACLHRRLVSLVSVDRAGLPLAHATPQTHWNQRAPCWGGWAAWRRRRRRRRRGRG